MTTTDLVLTHKYVSVMSLLRLNQQQLMSCMYGGFCYKNNVICIQVMYEEIINKYLFFYFSLLIKKYKSKCDDILLIL